MRSNFISRQTHSFGCGDSPRRTHDMQSIATSLGSLKFFYVSKLYIDMFYIISILSKTQIQRYFKRRLKYVQYWHNWSYPIMACWYCCRSSSTYISGCFFLRVLRRSRLFSLKLSKIVKRWKFLFLRRLTSFTQWK